MKFCPNCGAQLDDGMKFCGSCGAKLGETLQPAGSIPAEGNMAYGENSNVLPTGANSIPNQQSVPYSQPAYNQQGMGAAAAQPAKPNPFTTFVEKIKANPKIAIIAGAALVVVIVAIIVIVNVTKYQRIDAKDLFKFEFTGLNEYGSVEGELNCYDDYLYDTDYAGEALNAVLDEYGLGDLADYAGSSSTSKNEKEEVSPYFSLNDETLLDAWSKADDKSEAAVMRRALLKTNSKGKRLIKCTFDKEDGLKNGDKVKVTVEYDEDYLKDYKIKLKNTEFEIEVKNLEKGEKIDLFDEKYITVSFSGLDGRGTADVSTYDALGCISYYYDYVNNLSNGDKYTVTASYYGDLKKAGKDFYFEYDGKYYILTEEKPTKDYEVSGLTEIQSVDPFEGLKFTYDRGTPFLRITGVDTSGCDSKIKDYVRFDIENADSLDKGGKFTVKARDSYGGLENEGYQLAGTPDADGYVSKEFTVDDTYPSYIKADEAAKAEEAFADKLSDAVTTAREKIKGSKYISSVTLSNTAKSINSFDKVDTYVAFNKKSSYDAFSWSDSVNQLIVLYKVEVKVEKDDKEDKDTLYVAMTLANVRKDGSNYVSDNEFGVSYYKTLDDFSDEVLGSETYTVTKAGSTKSDDNSKAETTTTTTTAKAEESSKAEEKTTAATTTKKTEKAEDTTTSEVVP